MGLCSSKVHLLRVVYMVNEDRPGQGKMAELTFRRLGSEEKIVQKLFNTFNEIDVDNSGEIDLEEFYRAMPMLKRSPFTDRVFSIMDEDASGEIGALRC